MIKIKYCENCAQKLKGTDSWGSYENTEYIRGFITYLDDESVTKCPECDHDIITVNMSHDDFLTIRDASNCNRDLLFAMIKLHDDDPIEYELKIAQFREIAERKKQRSPNHAVQNADQLQSQLLIRVIHFSLDSLAPASL